MTTSFKNSLLLRLQEHILQKAPFIILWNCEHCDGAHSGDLFKKVARVEKTSEKNADIILFDGQDRPFVAVHVSGNIRPNLKTAKEFQDKGIIYIQLTSPNKNESDPIDMMAHPKFVNTCLNPKCGSCGRHQLEKSMFIIDSQCWKCNSGMKVAVMKCGHYHPGPDMFSAKELEFARSKGVLIKDNFSQTMGESYLSNTCPSCLSLTGQHYLFTDHLVYALNGGYNYEEHPAGYHCQYCLWDADKPDEVNAFD